LRYAERAPLALLLELVINLRTQLTAEPVGDTRYISK
jgi:hypothetical protein